MPGFDSRMTLGGGRTAIGFVNVTKKLIIHTRYISLSRFVWGSEDGWRVFVPCTLGSSLGCWGVLVVVAITFRFFDGR